MKASIDCVTLCLSKVSLPFGKGTIDATNVVLVKPVYLQDTSIPLFLEKNMSKLHNRSHFHRGFNCIFPDFSQRKTFLHLLFFFEYSENF